MIWRGGPSDVAVYLVGPTRGPGPARSCESSGIHTGCILPVVALIPTFLPNLPAWVGLDKETFEEHFRSQRHQRCNDLYPIREQVRSRGAKPIRWTLTPLPRKLIKQMSLKKSEFQKEKSNRIIFFADLRDSTEILRNFEQGIYHRMGGQSESALTYEKFIFDVHETSYRELYLGHENTYAEIYGDGVMGIFPEDNTKFILENIYRLTNKMRRYNDSPSTGVSQPIIDIGCSITVGKASFVYYPLDERYHPVGECIHEAARIEGVSKFYDARILISHRFLNFAEGLLSSDPRFSYRFIDRVVLKGFREPLTLFEILLDNDPRFELKKKSIEVYSNAYSKYCEKKWIEAVRKVIRAGAFHVKSRKVGKDHGLLKPFLRGLY